MIASAAALAAAPRAIARLRRVMGFLRNDAISLHLSHDIIGKDAQRDMAKSLFYSGQSVVGTQIAMA